MNEESFWLLFQSIKSRMPTSSKRKRGATPNGPITKEARLSMALRFCAGGDKYDIAAVHGVHPDEVLQSLWITVDAIHCTAALDISFPESHDEQKKLANEFKNLSTPSFDNCCAAVDGMLVWTSQPNKDDDIGIGTAKFFCGQKKFGLNMQGVVDARKRFLDVDISHPGSASDFTVWVNCSLREKVETDGFLFPGLTIFGDNAYINTMYMVTPFKNVNDGPKDDFNFYHSQLRINVECAFGILVHRWGILRKPMPCNFKIAKISSLVLALCKLHNFCIDHQDGNIPATSFSDSFHIVMDGGLNLTNIDTTDPNNYNYQTLDRINELLDGGMHLDDGSYKDMRRSREQDELPVSKMLNDIESDGYKRPVANRRANYDS